MGDKLATRKKKSKADARACPSRRQSNVFDIKGHRFAAKGN